MKNFYFLPLRDKPDTCRKENPRGKPMLPTRVWSLEISEYKRLKLLQAVLVLLDHLLANVSRTQIVPVILYICKNAHSK